MSPSRGGDLECGQPGPRTVGRHGDEDVRPALDEGPDEPLLCLVEVVDAVQDDRARDRPPGHSAGRRLVHAGAVLQAE